MQRQITLTIDESLYQHLSDHWDTESLNSLVITLLKAYLEKQEQEESYFEMANDTNREQEALEWSESCIGDIADETR